MRPRARRRGVIAQLLLALTLTLVACGGAADPPGIGRDILVLGVMAPSDTDEPAILGMIRGVELAVQEYNSDPDARYAIEITEFSTQAAPGEAGAGESEIANTDRLVGVVGPFQAADVGTLAPVLEGSGLSYMVPSVGAAGVPGEGWNGFRRLIANDRQEGRALADHAAGRVAGAIALVTESSDVGRPFAEGAVEALQALERPPSRTDTVEPDSTPANLATALTEAAPEAIVYGGGAESGKALLDALRSAGFQGLVVASRQLRAFHPTGVGAGVIGSATGADAADPGSANFVSRYRQEFDAVPPVYALEAYEGALMILDAVEEVQGSPRAVTEFLRLNTEFRGDSKRYRFDERGEPVDPPVWIYESTNEAWTLIGRSDRLEGD